MVIIIVMGTSSILLIDDKAINYILQLIVYVTDLKSIFLMKENSVLTRHEVVDIIFLLELYVGQ